MLMSSNVEPSNSGDNSNTNRLNIDGSDTEGPVLDSPGSPASLSQNQGDQKSQKHKGQNRIGQDRKSQDQQAQERNIQTQTQFEVTFERAAVGIAHVGLQGQWLRINQRLCDIVGYSVEELKNKRIQEITHPDDWEIDFIYIMQLLRGQRSHYSMEKRFIHKSGQPVWVKLSVVLVTKPSGGPDYSIATIQNIHPQKVAEANLQASEQRFQKAVIAAPFPAIICAEDGEILQISEGWTRLSGYRFTDIPTLTDWTEQAYGSEHKVDMLANINQLFKLDRIVDEGEFIIKTRPGAQKTKIDTANGQSPQLGSKRIWQFSTAPLGKLPDGRRAIIAMAADVTELKKVQQEIEQINQTLEDSIHERTAQLKAANDDLNAFAYTVSHDLRAPLRAMEGFSRILLEDYTDALDSIGQEYAQRIAHSAAHMEQLIQDILKYSRIGRANIQKRPVDLNQAINQVCDSLLATIQEKRAEITVEPALPYVEGTPQIINQILINLISNALKFVPPKTTPKISITSRIISSPADQLTATANAEPQKAETQKTEPQKAALQKVRLQIADNGIGIAPEYTERIFNAFERLHSAKSYQGTGIGLAIVKRGVERLGGQVGTTPISTGGTLFWVELSPANQ